MRKLILCPLCERLAWTTGGVEGPCPKCRTVSPRDPLIEIKPCECGANDWEKITGIPVDQFPDVVSLRCPKGHEVKIRTSEDNSQNSRELPDVV